ncbi:MAG: metallophosphoesterase [Nannocystaceae bacterium]|nr:metallophosphoesterase [Nannocystaceae bacterium]
MNRPPRRVTWIFASEDETVARDLLRLSAVLVRLGLIENWSVLDVPPGQDADAELRSRIARSDAVVVLSSPGLASTAWPSWRLALEGGPSVVPVVLRAGGPPELDRWVAVPRGVPLMVRNDRDAAMLEVIDALRDLAPLPRQVESNAGGQVSPVGTSINEIFATHGQPSVTFVAPSRFEELKLELRTMGTCLIVEGPSRTGKTTAVYKAMEALGVSALDVQRSTLNGAKLTSDLDLAGFTARLDRLVANEQDTWLFIDDFHYLRDPAYLDALTVRLKVLADLPQPHAKVTLIGINPVAESLVQRMPDLMGRYVPLRLDIDKEWERSTKIAELIILGEQAANIRFRHRDEFIRAAAGSFYLAQLLCNRAARQQGVLEAQATTAEITSRPDDVIEQIRVDLGTRYRAPLVQLAAFDRAAGSPTGASLSLLWLLSRAGDGVVRLFDARTRFPQFAATYDWFLESNLGAFLDSHPALDGLLYFRREAGTLTLEDPQLRFYLRELDWTDFALASGHGRVSFHPTDGPLWPKVTPADSPRVEVRGDGNVSIPDAVIVLHLSDVHIEHADQAALWYSQLAADLREQGVTKLDGLVVTGDLVQRAQPTEYDAAANLLESILEGFGLRQSSVAVVPGNHDVNWLVSGSAYTLRRRKELSTPLEPGTFRAHGDDVVEVRDESTWPHRFDAYAEFHRRVTGQTYPVDFREQGTLVTLATMPAVQILGLNSAWESDHIFPHRTSIHPLALGGALKQLPSSDPAVVRIAAFHHPLAGSDPAVIKDLGFLQRLALDGFRLALHGHVHRADTEQYRYDKAIDGRKLGVVTAGTFGAPTHEWVPGYPLQYNLLRIGLQQVTVETRCRRELTGAWEPDARWLAGAGADPVPRYTISL